MLFEKLLIFLIYFLNNHKNINRLCICNENIIDNTTLYDYFNLTPEEIDLIEKLLSNGGKVYSYPMLGYWLDIGSPEDYKKAQLDITSIIFNTTRTQ